jgi:uncharacterized protein involved in response to NO
LLGVLLWLPQYFGEIRIPTGMAPLDWHMHEMLFGYVAAVVTGFLLTAIPNWTGRLPVCGASLALLAALWLAGRIAILASGTIGALPAAVIDVSFLLTVALVALREIVSGRNWRNARVLVILGVLILGNIVFHAEVIRLGVADYGARIGIAAVIGLVMLIGGRIVPSFSHNWLVRNNPGRLPVPFGRFDAVSIAIAAAALVGWVAAPRHAATAVLLATAGVLHVARLTRWAGDRTSAERLVLVLHVAYAFVPIGFLLLAGATLWPGQIPLSAGVHAWTAGAIGLMTLAVMTRASLGHTGQPLTASAATQAIYGLAFVAASARIAAAFTGGTLLLHVSGLAWIAAFGTFVASFGPLLAGLPPVWAGHREVSKP